MSTGVATGHSTRRAVAVLCAVALTAALAGSVLAADVDSATKKKRIVTCDGKAATKVGTAGPDRLVGTAGRDIIAGLGGNDIIYGLGGNDVLCGGPGHDRLFGGPGRDKLLGQGGRDRLRGGTTRDRLYGGTHNDVLSGQGGRDLLLGGPGDDQLVGGTGIDSCLQGSGNGPRLACEWPPVPVLLPLTGVLAIAYSDIDGLAGYSTGDVLIAQLVDTDEDGIPSVGDTITMGRYPNRFTVTDPQSHFNDWGIRTHAVTAQNLLGSTDLRVDSQHGTHGWIRSASGPSGPWEVYFEGDLGWTSSFDDHHGDGSHPDMLRMRTTTPSKPPADMTISDPRPGDDDFVDVEILYSP